MTVWKLATVADMVNGKLQWEQATTVDGPLDELVSSMRVLELADITYRQLDHWVRTDRLQALARDGSPHTHGAHGSGIGRYFTPVQVERVKLMARLVRAGLTLDKAGEVAAAEPVVDARPGFAIWRLDPSVSVYVGSLPKPEES